jgi:hypothetical protein
MPLNTALIKLRIVLAVGNGEEGLRKQSRSGWAEAPKRSYRALAIVSLSSRRPDIDLPSVRRV